jgi:hypothetical protein
MKYSKPAILAASLALTSAPVFASHLQATDLEGSTRLTMKECLDMQAAKNDGATRADMKKACKWTSEEASSTNSLSTTESPRAVDTAPYGSVPATPYDGLPGGQTPPP